MVIAKNLKRKTLLISLLSLISIIVITFSYYRSTNLTKKNIEITELLNNLSITLEKINVLEKEFLDFEASNENFHKTGKSEVLNQTLSYFHEVENMLQDIPPKLGKDCTLVPVLDSVKIKINHHSTLFDSISICLKERGYKDHGLEGEMRKEIHFVEKHTPYANLAMILTLRRHEKDFFLRKESSYIKKVATQIKILKAELKNTQASIEEQKIYAEALDRYLISFNKIVKLEQTIGTKRKLGLSGKINSQFNFIINDINRIKNLINQKTKSKIHLSQFFYFTALFTLLCVTFISLYASRQLGKPIEKLSLSIQDAVIHNFSEDSKIYESRSQNEIASIGKNVQTMLSKIKIQKKFLTSKNIEVNQQNEILSSQKQELNNAFKLIEQKNKNLTDSISYAKYIQNSFLPTELKRNQIFPSNFVIYGPKAKVSGDFYLLEETEDTKTIIVCDCTGHGVPGAFMTVLGNMLLDNSLKKEKMSSPSRILEYLDCKITELLGTQKELNSEGMDISICVINKNTQELTYSGARSPLLLFNENKWKLVKGIKRSIGEQEFAKQTGHEFTNHTFKLQNNDKIFLWTDGYKDQFGGALNKKIGSKRLQNIIKVNEHESLQNLGKILKEELNSWRNVNQKTYDQIDDILVLGVEVDFESKTTPKIINEADVCC